MCILAIQSSQISSLTPTHFNWQKDESQLEKLTFKLFRALEDADEDTFNQLFTANAHTLSMESRDTKGRTLLMVACYYGTASMVAQLLKYGARAEATTLAGKTALSMAISAGNLDAARTLIKLDASIVQKVDNAGRSPLMAAAEVAEANKMGPAIVELLLTEGKADPHVIDPRGLTALDRLCATCGNIRAARSLLAHGARVRNETDRKHTMTTLMHAAMNGHRKLCVELVEKWGGNPKARNDSGGTAKSYAEAAGHIALGHLMDEYIAKMEAGLPMSSG
jgi:uncharacterized protein